MAGLCVNQAWGNRPPPFPSDQPKPAAPKPGLSIRIETGAKGKEAVLHISAEQAKMIVAQIEAQQKPQ